MKENGAQCKASLPRTDRSICLSPEVYQVRFTDRRGKYNGDKRHVECGSNGDELFFYINYLDCFWVLL
jgi:hypothetical protein